MWSHIFSTCCYFLLKRDLFENVGTKAMKDSKICAKINTEVKFLLYLCNLHANKQCREILIWIWVFGEIWFSLWYQLRSRNSHALWWALTTLNAKSIFCNTCVRGVNLFLGMRHETYPQAWLSPNFACITLYTFSVMSVRRGDSGGGGGGIFFMQIKAANFLSS